MLLVGVVPHGIGQGLFGMLRLSGSDDKTISYGFFLAAHTATYQMKYSEAFLKRSTSGFGGIHSIYPKYTPGFSLGFIGTLRFHDQVSLLFSPKVGFYEYRMAVNYFPSDCDPSICDFFATAPLPPRIEELVNEATLVELPLLLKYRSQRFNNTRMYFIGGGGYTIRVKSGKEVLLDPVVISKYDYTLEIGMGFEIYMKYFKFAPEIRFSHGLKNLYDPGNTDPQFSDLISSLKRKSITLYINFQ